MMTLFHFISEFMDSAHLDTWCLDWNRWQFEIPYKVITSFKKRSHSGQMFYELVNKHLNKIRPKSNFVPSTGKFIIFCIIFFWSIGMQIGNRLIEISIKINQNFNAFASFYWLLRFRLVTAVAAVNDMHEAW